MTKLFLGALIGFVLATAVFTVTVRVYAAGKLSVIRSCHDNGYFVYDNSLYECKKVMSNG